MLSIVSEHFSSRHNRNWYLCSTFHTYSCSKYRRPTSNTTACKTNQAYQLCTGPQSLRRPFAKWWSTGLRSWCRRCGLRTKKWHLQSIPRPPGPWPPAAQKGPALRRPPRHLQPSAEWAERLLSLIMHSFLMIININGMGIRCFGLRWVRNGKDWVVNGD